MTYKLIRAIIICALFVSGLFFAAYKFKSPVLYLLTAVIAFTFIVFFYHLLRKDKNEGNHSKKFIAIASCAILSGSILKYFYGYKNDSSINMFAYILGLGGWIIVFLFAIPKLSDILLDDEKIDFSKNRLTWLKIKFRKVAISLTIIITIIGNLYIVNTLSEQRVNKILTNEPTTVTTAKVKQLITRTTRGATNYNAIIYYSTSNYPVESEIDNYHWQFHQNQTIWIKYSNKYPDMFTVLGPQ